jgi:hypothetical protein
MALQDVTATERVFAKMALVRSFPGVCDGLVAGSNG